MPTAAQLTPRLDGHHVDVDQGPQVLAVSWALTTLATIFLALRIYCKLVGSFRRLWWDDWILVAAWVMVIAAGIKTTILVRDFGLGKHVWDMNLAIPDDTARFFPIFGARATDIITSQVWAKTSFAVTLLRLTTDRTRKLIWAIIISINVVGVVAATVPWVECKPLEKSWNRMLPGTCWTDNAGQTLWVVTAAYLGSMDVVLAMLPWKFLWGLPLKKKEKWGILTAMSMGVVAGAIAFVKCTQLAGLESNDPYDSIGLFVWDIVESTVTIMAACIPALRVLLRDVKSSSAEHAPFDNSVSLRTFRVRSFGYINTNNS
ncbi:hypothetical protein QBC43DRAFT_38585 [Cladorrhinum sp. PSN259]|nr:hypothetical protein QBC43DRAFT_38585 [Cladorrhinum sp. PSN259]